MADPSFRLVTFDLDGTLTRVHGWWVIAQAVHREAEYEASHRRFFAHEQTEDQHLKELLDLAVGLPVSEVERLLEATPKVGGISATVSALRAQGLKSALLTHNPEYVTEWYRRRFAFDAAEGTPGTILRAGTVVDSGPALADKPSGLRRLLREFRIGAEEVLHIGDGWADAALFRRVGGSIAFNSRLPEVRAAADASVEASSLEAVLPVIRRLKPHPPADDARGRAEHSNT